MTHTEQSLAVQFLLELGYLEAVDVSDPHEPLYLWTAWGHSERQRLAPLLRMAVEAPNVAQRILDVAEGRDVKRLTDEQKNRLFRLIELQDSMQICDGDGQQNWQRTPRSNL